MTDVILKANDLSVRFGGVLAVNKVSFEVRRGEVFTLIGPNGAGKTTVFNLISRIYQPSAGSIHFDGEDLVAQPAHAVAALGIARTFQNIELFEHATVLHNLLIGRHTHRATGFFGELFFTAATRRAEIAAREKAEQVIELLDLQHHRDSLVAGLPFGVWPGVLFPQIPLPAKVTLQGRAGDRLTIMTPGGGGYGDPQRAGALGMGSGHMVGIAA